MRKRYIVLTALAISLVCFIFVYLIPVIQVTALTPEGPSGLHIHFYRSISFQFSQYGTSYWNRKFYFSPDPPGTRIVQIAAIFLQNVYN